MRNVRPGRSTCARRAHLSSVRAWLAGSAVERSVTLPQSPCRVRSSPDRCTPRYKEDLVQANRHGAGVAQRGRSRPCYWRLRAARSGSRSSVAAEPRDVPAALCALPRPIRVALTPSTAAEGHLGSSAGWIASASVPPSILASGSPGTPCGSRRFTGEGDQDVFAGVSVLLDGSTVGYRVGGGNLGEVSGPWLSGAPVQVPPSSLEQPRVWSLTRRVMRLS